MSCQRLLAVLDSLPPNEYRQLLLDSSKLSITHRHTRAVCVLPALCYYAAAEAMHCVSTPCRQPAAVTRGAILDVLRTSTPLTQLECSLGATSLHRVSIALLLQPTHVAALVERFISQRYFNNATAALQSVLTQELPQSARLPTLICECRDAGFPTLVATIYAELDDPQLAATFTDCSSLGVDPSLVLQRIRLTEVRSTLVKFISAWQSVRSGERTCRYVVYAPLTDTAPRILFSCGTAASALPTDNDPLVVQYSPTSDASVVAALALFGLHLRCTPVS